MADGDKYKLKINGFHGKLKKGEEVTRVCRRDGGVYVLEKDGIIDFCMDSEAELVVEKKEA